MYTVAADSCNWHCSIQDELPCVSLGLLSRHRGFMSKYGIAHHHASISKDGTVNSSSSKCDGRNYSARILSLFTLVFVHLNPWSLAPTELGLMTIVAAFPNSIVSIAPMHGTVRS